MAMINQVKKEARREEFGILTNSVQSAKIGRLRGVSFDDLKNSINANMDNRIDPIKRDVLRVVIHPLRSARLVNG